MSEINTLLILSWDKNKGEYISSDKVEKYEVEVCINNQSFPDKKTRLLGTAQVSKKKRGIFVPEEKRAGGDIK